MDDNLGYDMGEMGVKSVYSNRRGLVGTSEVVLCVVFLTWYA
jgi:hypothetical protein